MTAGVHQMYSWSIIGIVITVISYFYAYQKSRKNEIICSGYYWKFDLNKIWSLTCFFIIIGLILGIAYVGQNPFIYFQF